MKESNTEEVFKTCTNTIIWDPQNKGIPELISRDPQNKGIPQRKYLFSTYKRINKGEFTWTFQGRRKEICE